MAARLFSCVTISVLGACAQASGPGLTDNEVAAAARTAAANESTPAPESEKPGNASAGAPLSDDRRDKTIQVVERAPWQPPAEVDPVPPPVEGSEPREKPRP